MSIQIVLDRAAVAPGETVTGEATWTLTTAPKQFGIRLFWHTSGKASRDTGIAGEQIVMNAAARGSQRFSFVAPSKPVSYDGPLVSILWAVEAFADADDTVHEYLIISPTRERLTLSGA
ncbi:hypothetical protein LBMAG53_09670 [Planctomycetota bacterium]|nr:hypothetical protein LBMAG53_09670 [Planctomycetota bacterium]